MSTPVEYMKKTETLLTGEVIYYRGLVSHIISDPTNLDSKITDENGKIIPSVLSPAAITSLEVFSCLYNVGNAWVSALQEDTDNLPGSNKRALILYNGLNWVGCTNDNNTWSWDVANPVAATLYPTKLYFETVTGKLYMYIEGQGLQQIATPGSGGGTSGSSDLVLVTFPNNTSTYPNPTAWTPAT